METMAALGSAGWNSKGPARDKQSEEEWAKTTSSKCSVLSRVSNASERKPHSDLDDRNDCHIQSSTSIGWLSIKQPRK